jgi:hypothetical protein
MFNKSPDERLSEWKKLRESLDHSNDPLTDLSEFWSNAPLTAFNHTIDQYNSKSWPTPWEIIAENRYDDFTISLMMAWTLKLTTKFANSRIDLRTMVDEHRTKLYNLVYIDNDIVLNYDKWKSIKSQEITESLLMENLVDIEKPR